MELHEFRGFYVVRLGVSEMSMYALNTNFTVVRASPLILHLHFFICHAIHDKLLLMPVYGGDG